MSDDLESFPGQPRVRSQLARASAAVADLLRTADLVRRDLAAVVEPYGITLQQYNVLRILRGAGSSLATLEIAERMIERAPGITRLLDRLEAKGLVHRERSPLDRRQVLCRLSPAGLALVGRLDRPVNAADEAAVANLDTKGRLQLIRLLNKLQAR